MAAPTIAAVGTAYSTPNNATTPMTATGGTMPTHQVGDVLLMFAFFDTGATTSSQTLSTPAGWTSLGVDADNLTHGMLFHVYFKYCASAAETFTSPSFTGGTTGTTGASGIVRVMTLRPSGSKLYPSSVSAANLVANSGTATFITTAAQNITSIGGFTPDENDTLICVYGGKRDDWTSVATLTGDSLTYTEQIDTPVTVGADAGMVVDTAPQTTAGAIAAKTFTVTGGATEKSCGRAFALSQVVALATLERSAAITLTPAVTTAGRIDPYGTPANASLILAADRITGLSDGASVSSWAGSAGTGNSAAQVTGGNQPTWQTNELNGLPVVQFDGTDDYMTVAGITNSVAARTIFVVYDVITPTAGDGIFGLTNNASITMAAAGTVRYTDTQASTNKLLGSADTNPHLIVLRWNSTSSCDGYHDADAAQNFDPSDAYQSGSAAFTIGARQSAGTDPGNVNIAEIAVYDSALSDTDLGTVRAALIAKWLTAAANPVKYRASGSFTTKLTKVRASGSFTTKTVKVRSGGAF